MAVIKNDFQIQFKFSNDRRWVVIDIETQTQFDGKYLADILRNLADNIQQEPALNEEVTQIRNPESEGSPLTNADSEKYCGAV